MKIHPPLFVIFIAIVWTAANEENSPIVRLERYEYNSPSGSKISPKTVLNDNILLCCFPLIRRNPIQQTTISCKTTCNLIRPTGALYVRDISDSSSSLPIRNRPQFSSSSSSSSTFISGSAYGYGHLTGSVPSGDTNGKLRSFKLRIPIPAIKPHYTASRGTVQEILIPKRFRQYKRICGNITHNRVYTKYEPPTVISNGYSSIYRYPEGRSPSRSSFPSYIEIPSINSGNAYMTKARGKSVTSYLRPTNVTIENKRTHTLDTTQANYPNSNRQIEVVASKLAHEIPNDRKRKLRQ